MVFSHRQVPHTELPNSLHSFWSVKTQRDTQMLVSNWQTQAQHNHMCNYTLTCMRAPLHTHPYAFHCSSCFQCNGCTARVSQEACGVAVLSKRSRQQEWPRIILSQQPKNLWRELKGDVPGGETPLAYNGVIHTSLRGEGVQAAAT